MKKIGLISDTHGYLDDSVFKYFDECDEIWHAGDFGTLEVADKLAAFKPLKGVFGNIDGKDIRLIYPEHLRFKCEEVDVWMTHIGGYPGRYNPKIKASRERAKISSSLPKVKMATKLPARMTPVSQRNDRAVSLRLRREPTISVMSRLMADQSAQR